MICVLIASLLECFIVLPAHLRNAFNLRKTKKGASEPAGPSRNPIARFRTGFESRFNRFREGPFRRFSQRSLEHRGITMSCVLALAIVTVGLLAGGRLGFNFFPTPEPSVLYANASFVAGTDGKTVDRFMTDMQRTLNEAESALGGDLILHAVTTEGATQGVAEALAPGMSWAPL